MSRPPRILSRPPWHFRLAKSRIRNQRRWGYGMVEIAERLGLLNCVVRYTLPRDITLDVPLFRRVNQWDWQELISYEAPLIDCLAERIPRLTGPVRLIDCGADIGTVSALLVARCTAITTLWVIEPNPLPYQYLSHSVQRWPIVAKSFNAAVSEYSGHGRLVRSPLDPSDHSRSLEPAEDGEIEVIRVDDLKVPHVGSLVLKIDVEGGEASVLRGATETLRRAHQAVVAFEAHRDVCRRTGIDPTECLKILRKIRAFNAVVSERPEITLTTNLPYFEQVREPAITNVVCQTE